MSSKFPDYVPPTKIAYLDGRPSEIHLRKCKFVWESGGRRKEKLFDQSVVTLGAMDDNDLVVNEETVSRYHCKVMQEQDGYVLVDLSSTNGTFINGEKITEAALKPGGILRLGRIELRLESDTPGAAAPKKPVEQTQTVAMQRGVSLSELESGARGGFDTTSKGFSKKDDKAGKLFWIAAIAVGLVLVMLLIYVFAISGK